MRRWSSVFVWVLVVAGLLLAGAAAGRPDEGIPFDPASTRPLGTRALVLLVEELGATVSTHSAPAGADTAVLFADHHDADREAEMLDWVRAGGVLVVADPFSDLAPPLSESVDPFASPPVVRGRSCALRALAGVERLAPPGAVAFRASQGTIGCYPVEDGFLLVARSEGAGTIVAIAGAEMFVNDYLGEADHAALIAALLVPSPGTRVTVLEPPAPGEGQEVLADLIPGRVKHAVWQLLVAAVLLALWRGRRLGDPVEEPQPVQLEASELVIAVGHLLQQARRRDQAADVLRLAARRTLSERLGLPIDSPAAAFASGYAARTGRPADEVRELLEPRPPATDADLVGIARTVDHVREEMLDAR